MRRLISEPIPLETEGRLVRQATLMLAGGLTPSEVTHILINRGFEPFIVYKFKEDYSMALSRFI